MSDELHRVFLRFVRAGLFEQVELAVGSSPL